jgi:D-sedoheptulose 7-phosphate isomerase
MTDAIATIQHRLQLAADVTIAMARNHAPAVAAAADLITTRFRAGGKLLLCGNGGSAADCQHLAAEFVSRLTRDVNRPALPAIALTTDSSYLTGYANDFGFDGVFARQIEALGTADDVLMAISTSGSSRNILAAVDAARHKRVAVVALLGEDGPLGQLADVAVRVPSRDTQVIQQVHLAVEHLICQLVEQAMYP